MKSRIASVVFSAGLATLPAFSLSAQDKPDSSPPPAVGDTTKLDKSPAFMGMAFGTPFDESAGFSLDQDRGQLKLYTKKDGLANLGPARLEEVVYYFFDEKFYGVALHTNDGQDSSNLLRVLQLAYGYGEPVSQNEPSFVWIGKSASARYGLNAATGAAEAFIYDNALDKAWSDYQEKQAAEAAGQL